MSKERRKKSMLKLKLLPKQKVPKLKLKKLRRRKRRRPLNHNIRTLILLYSILVCFDKKTNIFVCEELDADDDDDEEEVAPKKEKVKEAGPSLRDLIASTDF
jgi:hypothetical protein